MKSFLAIALLFVASVFGQSCPQCNPDLAALGAYIQVCGSDASRTYNVLDFNLISFNDVAAAGGGDVEGRVLVGGSLLLSGNAGYSIGDKIVNYPANAPDALRAYSAIVGGNINWMHGQLNPVANDNTHRIENGIYYGNTAAVAPYLRFSQCPNGTLDISSFVTALEDLSTAWSQAAATVHYQMLHNNQIMMLSGSSSSACSYLLRVSVADWNIKSGFSAENWNYGANVVIDFNCTGAEVVYLRGAEFPGLATNIVYNFGPSCANTLIEANSVTGTIVAPYSTLDQTDGRIYGNVYVNNVENFLQINDIDCPGNPVACDCCDLCVVNSPVAKCGKTSNKFFSL